MHLRLSRVVRSKAGRPRFFSLTCGVRLCRDNGALRGDVHDLPVLFLDHAFEADLVHKTATIKSTVNVGWGGGGLSLPHKSELHAGIWFIRPYYHAISRDPSSPMHHNYVLPSLSTLAMRSTCETRSGARVLMAMASSKLSEEMSMKSSRTQIPALLTRMSKLPPAHSTA